MDQYLTSTLVGKRGNTELLVTPFWTGVAFFTLTADPGQIVSPMDPFTQKTHVPADVAMFIYRPANEAGFIGIKKGTR
jgi:hypothetical protein